MTNPELLIVMPVFNEEASVEKVLDEWIRELNSLSISFQILAIDDGSRDQTYSILKNLEKKYGQQILPQTQSNIGHGQTCIKGYKYAVTKNIPWVLQIDSDGQCDPKYFKSFWEKRSTFDAIHGFRKTREDGYTRLLVSRMVRLTVWIATRTWVRDPNIPYRLLRTDLLKKFVEQVPQDIYLANILVSVLTVRHAQSMVWIDINFRNRFGGTPSLNFRALIRRGWELFWKLV